MSTTDEYADEVLAATDDYLTELRACVDLLPVALGAYGGDDFESAVARLCERESAADAAEDAADHLLFMSGAAH